MIFFYGDSNGAAYGLSNAANGVVGKFAPVNYSVSASQAAEVSSAVQQLAPVPFGLYGFNVGLNDVSRYLGDAAKKEHFRKAMRAAIAWPALPDKKTGRGAQAGITFTGTWADSPSPDTCGKYTSQNGATATATVSGDTVFVGVSDGDYVGMGESIDVTIDGVSKGTFSVKAPGVATWLNQWWSRVAWKFTGLGAGNHTVVVTQNSPNGKFLHLDWIAGSDQTTKTRVQVGNVTKCSAAWYAGSGVTEAMISDYNSIIADVVAEFSYARLVDLFSAWNAAAYLQADGAHWNETGHAIAHYKHMEVLLA